MADLFTMQLNAYWKNAGGTTTHKTIPLSTWAALEESMDELYDHHIEAAIGAGSTLGLTHFATGVYLVVRNRDGANFVNVTNDNAAAATVVTKILAGQIMITPDWDPSATVKIVADTAVVLCDVLAVGT